MKRVTGIGAAFLWADSDGNPIAGTSALRRSIDIQPVI
jgi:hypothetical protein